MQPRAFQPHRAARYGVAYLIWVAVASLGLVAGWEIREAALRAVVLTRLGPWVLGLVDKLAFLILGLGWLILVLASEPYLRAGARTATLGRRSRRLLATEVAVILAGLLFSQVSF